MASRRLPAWPLRENFGQSVPSEIKVVSAGELRELVEDARSRGRPSLAANAVESGELGNQAAIRVLFRELTPPAGLRCSVCALEPGRLGDQFLLDISEVQFAQLRNADFEELVRLLHEALDSLPTGRDRGWPRAT